jgi:putative ABC transport system permease protein
MIGLLSLVFTLNASVFAVASGLLWARLPYASQDRLVQLTLHSDRMGMPLGWSRPYFQRIKEGSTRIELVAAYIERKVTIDDTSGHNVGSVEALVAQPELFEVLNQSAWKGRVLQALDAREGAEPTAVIGEDYWRSQFGADDTAIGSFIVIDGTRRRIVGVMPRSFAFPLRTTQVWIPLTIAPEDLTDDQIGSFGNMRSIGRLAPSADIGAATSEMMALSRSTQPLQKLAESIGLRAQAEPLRNLWLEGRKASLLSLLAATAMVFAVTLINAYTLFLLRVLRRRKEFAILESVGASPRHAHAQVAIEAGAICAVAALLGACLLLPAFALLRSLDVMPTGVPVNIGLNTWSIAALAAMATVSWGVFVSAAGALDAGNLYDSLRQSAHGQTATAGTQRMRRILLVGQIALTLVLLVGTALLVRSSQKLLGEDVGFAREQRLVGVMRINVDDEQAGAGAAQARALSWLRTVQGVRGVEAAALATSIPLSNTVILEGFRASGGDSGQQPREAPRAYQYYVGSQYFDALGLALVRGRGFSAAETAAGAPVAVIDERIATSAFGGRDPIGKSLTTLDNRGSGFIKAQIVGIVSQARQRSLGEDDPYPSIYLPDETPLAREGFPRSRVEFVAKTSDPGLLQSAIVPTDSTGATRVELLWTATMQERIAETIADQSRLNLLLEILSGFAILLSGAGLYALLANAVQARRREFGIRLALGAGPGDIRSSVMREGMKLILYGLVIGLPLAVLLGSHLQPRLHGITGHDPLVLVASLTIIVAIGLIANAIPAQRASLSDPSEVLRSE